MYRKIEEEDKDPARRILWMVYELHRMGYEQLRIYPYMAPSGMYWRCGFESGKGRYNHESTFTTGQGMACFGWKDAEQDDPAELAKKFIERFPNVAADTKGPDPAYVAWFEDAVRKTAPGGVPYLFADWPTKEGVVLTLGCGDVELPLPPEYGKTQK